jgi:hypothetical protein
LSSRIFFIKNLGGVKDGEGQRQDGGVGGKTEEAHEFHKLGEEVGVAFTGERGEFLFEGGAHAG